ncbi:PQQ-binding-like beta-propeller repeat protein [Mycobacterium sp. SM1]|nr:PQQ-binding-like beta-propeller repeat protein [Mycobacterium sp. SM1]
MGPGDPKLAPLTMPPAKPATPERLNVYARAGAGSLAGEVVEDRPLVYVPHDRSGDVWEIDPATYEVVAKYPVGREIQHVVPAYDMRTLYATDDVGNQMLAFDARTGQPARKIPIIDPYNLYFTPDGRFAISAAERQRELIWYDPVSWQLLDKTSIPACAGINHADFSVDGRTAVFSCEFAGRVAVVDVTTHRLLRMIDMPVRHTHMGPQDVRLAPDGSVYYIADCDGGGVWILDGAASQVLRFVPTGRGAHGLYFSRDATRLFVTNRSEGSISVLDAYTGAPISLWRLPGGGSPDMGNLTADGTQLWVSGRYHNVVYVLSTTDGTLLHTIKVGNEPHGLAVWPQPGRHSLGHTGITR